jgi:hypothetical protein
VGHGGRGGRDVVDGDVVGRTAVDALAQQDQRGRGPARRQLVGAGRDRAQQHAVDEVGAEVLQDPGLPVAVAVGLVDQHRPALRPGCPHDVHGQLGEVRDVEVRQRESDDARPAAAEVARGQVGPVVEVGDRPVDPVPGRRRHVDVPVDDVRHGLHRDAGPPGDVGQPGRAGPVGRAAGRHRAERSPVGIS